MAIKEELVVQRVADAARMLTLEIYGEEGPPLDADIDELEDWAVLAARAAFDGVLAQALRLQAQRLPKELPCPGCQGLCEVRREERTVRGRLGSATIQEPVCHCPACERDFFPSAGGVAAG